MKTSEFHRLVKSMPKETALAFRHLEERINEVASIHVEISEAEKQSILKECRALSERFEKLSAKVDSELSKIVTKSEAVNTQIKAIASELRTSVHQTMKQKTIKTQKLVFQKLPFPDDPLLIFEVTGNQRDVDEATSRVRRQVLSMDNGVWDESLEAESESKKRE